MALKVGITGGIGSGKTTVCRIFELFNIPVYYADQRAKSLMVHDLQLKDQIKTLFGYNAYSDDGLLNREYIANRIYDSDDMRSQLNAIVHPAVHRDFRSWASQQDHASYVLEEAALIFESGGHHHMDKMITVYAPIELRLNWVMKRNGFTREQVMDRMSAQMSDEEKISKSDYVIVNDLQSSLIRQVREIHHILMRENH